MPFYNQLAQNSWGLGWSFIEEKSGDYGRIMYYLCRMLYFRDKIVREFGDLQFADLGAERIVNNIWQDINQILVKRLGHITLSRFISLAENNMLYHEFHNALLSNENDDIYSEFVEWLSNGLSEVELEQMEKTMWYAQLIMFEANHVYHLWYAEEPSLESFQPKLKHYLQKI
jgi:hypothetical protein